MVILLPALFALMFLGMQAALMYQGRAVALAAAQEGAREAASETGTAVGGIRTAEGFVAASTSGLKNTTVEGRRTATQATITVTATTLSVVPGWEPKITQSASMPVERVT
jgi:Flp pilus assembly protein TadG